MTEQPALILCIILYKDSSQSGISLSFVLVFNVKNYRLLAIINTLKSKKSCQIIIKNVKYLINRNFFIEYFFRSIMGIKQV